VCLLKCTRTVNGSACLPHEIPRLFEVLSLDDEDSRLELGSAGFEANDEVDRIFGHGSFGGLHLKLAGGGRSEAESASEASAGMVVSFVGRRYAFAVASLQPSLASFAPLLTLP